ncbi:MAG: peroxiredoxin-like family protein [Cyclobacteriaceae bacterium]
MSVQTQLDARRADFNQKAPQTTKEAYQRGIDSVINSGILQQARQEGDTAIDFTLPNAQGQSVSLKEYLQKGPVVLTWYRGGWCPYCNITLRALQQSLPAFKAEGANLLALTPELPDKSLSTQEKNELEFEVLTDQNSEIARKYGLVFKLTPEVSELYKKNFSLEEYNGNDSDELPLAATYVIDQQKVVQYAFLDAEYRHRAEPQQIIEVLQFI